jgi:hypothetical protein
MKQLRNDFDLMSAGMADLKRKNDENYSEVKDQMEK